jgi:diacylglycerol kinase (ATP)
MRRVAILYNPRSGRASTRRRAEVDRAAAVLRAQGIEVHAEPTAGPRCADRQAKQFIAEGFDAIVASGGDGTVHDVLQGVVGTDAVLGVLPLGTANSLAADLGLSRDPARAAAELLAAEPQHIAAGRIDYERSGGRRESRYFTVAAGVGVDAELFYTLNARVKQRWGMAAYVGESLRQWVVQRFHPFQVDFFDAERQQQRTEVVTQLLAVRIADFGGVLKQLAPGADLMSDYLRLVLFKTASRARYLRFATGRLVGRDWTDPQIELVNATEVSCLPRAEHPERNPRIYCEADGEILGRLPVNMSIVPGAFHLLIPAKK